MSVRAAEKQTVFGVALLALVVVGWLNISSEFTVSVALAVTSLLLAPFAIFVQGLRGAMLRGGARQREDRSGS